VWVDPPWGFLAWGGRLGRWGASKYETGDLLLQGELLVEFARVLGVSTDDILGIHSRRAKPALPAVDKTLACRLAQLQALPRRDGDALLRTLDAFLAKSSRAA